MNGRMQLLCSTGAFSRFPDITDYRSILRYGPELIAGGVDGLEVMYFPDWTTDIELVAAGLGASGLRFPVVHAEKGIGPALISEQAEERARASVVGSQIPLLEVEDQSRAAEVRRLLRRTRERLGPAGSLSELGIRN